MDAGVGCVREEGEWLHGWGSGIRERKGVAAAWMRE